MLTTLSRHFDIEITVKNEKIASFTYDFVCKGNDLNYVLEVMQSITPVSFKKISEYLFFIVVYTMVYIVSMWNFGMNVEEKALVAKLLQRGKK